MQAKQHNNPIAPNGQPIVKQCAFVMAFVPNQSKPNITRIWANEASRAIRTLIDFRSSLHRWQAAGRVNDAEFVAELQRLEDAGLSSGMDELIGLAMAAVARSEQ